MCVRERGGERGEGEERENGIMGERERGREKARGKRSEGRRGD